TGSREDKVVVSVVMWTSLATPNMQVRATASSNLSKLAARAKSAVNKTELDTAQRTLIAADIKRFLERPIDLQRPIALPAPDAPPGAPIGDLGWDWLAPAPWYPRSMWTPDREPPM